MLIVLQVLHVAVAATAFAITLSMGGALRRAGGQGREVKSAIAALTMRSGQLAGIFGILTLLTGLALVFYMGGFKVVAPAIHAGMGIVLVMILHGALFMRPTSQRIIAAADQDDASWSAAVKRFNIGHGIMQLLWLVTLVLMFIKR